MKYLILLTLLASCASTGDLKQKKPILDLESSKQPEKIYNCINEKWSNHNIPLGPIKFENGFQVTLIDSTWGGAFGVVIIVPKENGSNVKYHESKYLMPSWPVDEIKECI